MADRKPIRSRKAPVSTVVGWSGSTAAVLDRSASRVKGNPALAKKPRLGIRA